MNKQLHPIFQRALAPFTPLDVEPIKVGGTLLEPGNDESAPRYMRAPEQDKRASRGDSFNGNAWLDVRSGQVRYFSTGYDANAGQWDRAYSLERAVNRRDDSRELQR